MPVRFHLAAMIIWRPRQQSIRRRSCESLPGAAPTQQLDDETRTLTCDQGPPGSRQITDR